MLRTEFIRTVILRFPIILIIWVLVTLVASPFRAGGAPAETADTRHDPGSPGALETKVSLPRHPRDA
ncbi:MAG: hypothetical protein Kow0026_12530 [Oricola sp.]